jgi:hypothetical protein
MHTVHKRIVVDEDHKPVAVQIDYADWLEIERLLDLRNDEKRGVDLSVFAGKLKMDLPEDPVTYQRRIRDEWA